MAAACRYLLAFGLIVAYPAKLIYNFADAYRTVYVLKPWMHQVQGMDALTFADGLMSLVLLIGSIAAGLVIVLRRVNQFWFVVAFVVVAGSLSLASPLIYWTVGLEESLRLSLLRGYPSELPTPIFCTTLALILLAVVWRTSKSPGIKGAPNASET